MSASESSPLAVTLQESIEHLIAETVRRSQTTHDEELEALRTALQEALTEIDASQAAMTKAAETLRTALGTTPAESPAPENRIDEVTEEAPAPTETATELKAIEPTSTPETGPHELDVIAHDVTIGIATNLQTMLRGRPEVTNAQTQQFVNGELRLKLKMANALDIAEIEAWVGEHNGRIATRTDSVIELQFSS